MVHLIRWMREERGARFADIADMLHRAKIVPKPVKPDTVRIHYRALVKEGALDAPAPEGFELPATGNPSTSQRRERSAPAKTPADRPKPGGGASPREGTRRSSRREAEEGARESAAPQAGQRGTKRTATAGDAAAELHEEAARERRRRQGHRAEADAQELFRPVDD
ncbi:hypothetical protein [Rhodovibrio sodomensis]|uniref:hypothetical protein n=1 Tax=Rhodovibrio sodomensis TaxID=1088 RepID=UPI0019082F19|nr:hypothetical protein [Rhodovibrio sodomensis]